jgi:hypothetical protein
VPIGTALAAFVARNRCERLRLATAPLLENIPKRSSIAQRATVTVGLPNIHREFITPCSNVSCKFSQKSLRDKGKGVALQLVYMFLQDQPPPVTRAQIGILAFVILVVSLLAALMMWTGSGPRPSRQQNQQSGARPLQDYGSFSIVALGITAVFLGFLVMLLFADRFGDLASALGFLTALFGAVTGLVGTYFGIKSSSDAREGAQRLAASPAGDTRPPQVTSTSPVDGAVEVPPDIHPTATFSKDMDSATINPDTFKLLEQVSSAQVLPRAPDGVVYDSATRTATFRPANPLGSGRTYAATITAAARDRVGNTLAQDYTWHFTVAS